MAKVIKNDLEYQGYKKFIQTVQLITIVILKVKNFY